MFFFMPPLADLESELSKELLKSQLLLLQNGIYTQLRIFNNSLAGRACNSDLRRFEMLLTFINKDSSDR